jgi:subtilisin family serine protease
VGTWVSQTDLNCFPGNGTSFATPVLAGAVACYWQAHRKINNMGIMRQMKAAASNADSPNNFIGWGIPNLCRTDFDFVASVDPETSVVQISLLDGNYGKIKVTLTDMNGKTLHTKELETTEKDLFIDGFSLTDGIYVVTVKTTSGTKSRKIAK